MLALTFGHEFLQILAQSTSIRDLTTSEWPLLLFLWQQNRNVVATEITLSKQKYNFQLQATARPLGFLWDDVSGFLMSCLDNCYPRSCHAEYLIPLRF